MTSPAAQTSPLPVKATANRAIFGHFLATNAAARLHDEVGDEVRKYDMDAHEDDRYSVTSVANRAQNAAKNFVNAGYKAFIPNDEVEQDTRELLTPVSTQLEKATAKMKLESMSHKNIVVTLFFLYFSAVMSLFAAIVVAILTAESTFSLNAALACFAIEGVSRTIAVFLVIILLLLFPIRLIRYMMRNRDAGILPEQNLLVWLLFLIMVTPGMSVYSPYLFWNQYQKAYDFTLSRPVFVNETSAGEVFTLYFFFTTNQSQRVRQVTSVFTIILMSFLFVFVGLTVHYFGSSDIVRQRKSKRRENSASASSRSDIESGSGNELAQQSTDDEQVDGSAKARTAFEAMSDCFGDYAQLFWTMDRRLLAMTTTYLIVSIVLVLVYDYLPSQVPLVGMISVLKACPASYNSNVTSTNCNPSFLGGVPFARAMSVMAQFVMEVFMFYYLRVLVKRTRHKLKQMPYEKYRSSHLGFRYFLSNTKMMFFFAMLAAIIIVAVRGLDLETYLVGYVDGIFTLEVSPLNQVGINFFSLGFGPFYLLLACFSMSLARAYLPPDSQPGFAGFCCGGKPDAEANDIDHPNYLVRESDVELLERHRQMAKVQMLREKRRRARIHARDREENPNGKQAAGLLGFDMNNLNLGKLVPGRDPAQATTEPLLSGASAASQQDDEEAQYSESPRAASSPPMTTTTSMMSTPASLADVKSPGAVLAATTTDDITKTPGTTVTTSSAIAETPAQKTPLRVTFLENPVSQTASPPNAPQNDSKSADPPHTLAPSTSEINPEATTGEKLAAFLQGKVIPKERLDKYTEQYRRLSGLLRPKDAVEMDALEEWMERTGRSALPLIALQMNANLFCMETEVLMLNLSFITYCFGSYNDAKALTTEEKQTIIGRDARYRLVAHVENALTDIQACVFTDSVDDQRIYVAFRGTSTSKNIWQDLDYAQVPHKGAAEVEPYLSDPADVVARSAASYPPRVHRGFFLAYESVREAVLGIVSDLIDARPDGCVVFVAGHSLGGALATHFGFDLGLKYPLVRSPLQGLQVSTFGSPRVGNYSYVSRHRRIVPTTHRFCIGGDPVPKLPPARPFADFTKWGYHHVGVEILLDVDRVNLLVGPTFIERQIQHGWGGYIPRNHVTGSYVLSLALWCARVHPDFTPDWWLPVVNFILRAERTRLKVVYELKPSLMAPMQDQLYKEGATIWTEDSRAMRNHGCDTSMVDTSSSTSLSTKKEEEGVAAIERALASCGMDQMRPERAQFLVAQGLDTLDLLSTTSPTEWENIKSKSEGLVDDEMIHLLMRSFSVYRCAVCDFTPVRCPRCEELALNAV